MAEAFGLLVFVISIGLCFGGNILVMLPMPTFSHTNAYLPIFEELARRGHNVTVVSPFPRKEPLANYTDIAVPFTISEVMKKIDMDLHETGSLKMKLQGLWAFCPAFLDAVLPLPELQAFINEDRSSFDLIITETWFCQEPLAALSHKYSAHLVTMQPLMMGSVEALYTGNTVPYSYVPNLKMYYSDRMSFAERLINTLVYVSETLLKKFVYQSQQEWYMREYLRYNGSENLPPLGEILKNHSLVLLDSHFSLSYPKPYHQNVVEFGGLSIRPARPLPRDLEKFMSEAKDGVILLSWGSHYKSTNMKSETLAKFLKVFSKLPQRVLMKWEDPELPGKPANVKIAPWLPQNSILAHPNVVAFISHCGIHGISEAMYHGVPVLGTPLFADQYQNLRVLEQAGFAMFLDIDSFTEEYLLQSLQMLVNDARATRQMISWGLLWFLALCAGLSSGANILGMLPMPIYSHSNAHLPILEALARRGHNVTVVSPFPRNEPLANYTDIVIPNTISLARNYTSSDIRILTGPLLTLVSYSAFCSTFLKNVYSLPELQKFINEDRSHFDLVITETFFCQEAFAAMAHKYSAHHIAVHPLMLGVREAYYTGNTVPYSYVPHMDMPTTDRMPFFYRLYSSFANLLQIVLEELFFHRWQVQYMKENFKYPGSENLPPLKDLLQNHSLIMLDYHFSMSHPRPYLQNVVQLGGLSIKKPKPLPEDLERIMSEAKEGVIYFNLGSFFKTSSIEPEMLVKFLSAFSKLKQRVLMKWEEDEVEGLPGNVKISKWFPQTSILAHPNLKVFISHCGTHGFNEATYHSVPVLGTPLFGDQHQNIKLAEHAGYGIHMDITNFSEEELVEKLEKLIYDPSYKKAAIRRSKIMKDRPISAEDSAVYWVEYVLRHDGARHLRPASLDLTWYQYFLLDVIGVALLTLAVLPSLTCYSIWYCCCKRRRKGSEKENLKNKKD